MLKVTCALIINDNKLLVAQNNKNSDHPFQWEFPGGKIKNWETAEICIQREIREELNIEIEVLTKMNPVQFDYGIKHIELIPFICTAKPGKIILNEHHTFKWISADELPGINFSEADKKLIGQKENLKILKEYIWK